MKHKDTNMIYGIRAAIEAIKSGQEFEKIFIQKNLKGDLIKELYQVVGHTTAPISKVPIEKLNRFTRKNHQGVVAFISPVTYHKLDHLVASIFESGDDPFLLMLDRITDVRNFGAIARSAEGMGAHGIIIPSRNAAQINSDAIKTSAGALTQLPVCRVNNLLDEARYLKNSGCKVVACTEKGNLSIDKVSLSGPLLLVFGSEEDGITDELLKESDELARIPMKGEIASLNVSASTAICCYEVLRQRG